MGTVIRLENHSESVAVKTITSWLGCIPLSVTLNPNHSQTNLTIKNYSLPPSHTTSATDSFAAAAPHVPRALIRFAASANFGTMARNIAIGLVAVGVAGAYVARGPVAPAMRGVAVSRQPAFMRPAFPQRSASVLRMMADKTEEAEEVCIEDEAIEECTLVSWKAGEVKVREPHRLSALTTAVPPRTRAAQCSKKKRPPTLPRGRRAPQPLTSDVLPRPRRSR